MSAKTENLPHAGGYIISELNTFSRETVTINQGQNLRAGAVLGRLTASPNAGQYKAYDNAAGDGSETAVAILYDDCDATDGDKEAVAHIRGPMEVREISLVFAADQDAAAQTAAIADLANIDIITR